MLLPPYGGLPKPRAYGAYHLGIHKHSHLKNHLGIHKHSHLKKKKKKKKKFTQILKTQHIYLIERHDTPIKNKIKTMYIIYTNFFFFFLMYTIFFLFSFVIPLRGLPKPKGL
jgi:hypothetical protein